MKTLLEMQVNSRKNPWAPTKYRTEPKKRVTTYGKIMAPKDPQTCEWTTSYVIKDVEMVRSSRWPNLITNVLVRERQEGQRQKRRQHDGKQRLK